MLLFISHVPGNITKKELTEFIRSSGGHFWRLLPFIHQPTIAKCEILRIKDRLSDTIEYHGLISIRPIKTSASLLTRLDGERLSGKPVCVRQYYKRSTYKDRRRLHADLELLPEERRNIDRRRPFLVSTSRRCRAVHAV